MGGMGLAGRAEAFIDAPVSRLRNRSARALEYAR